MLQELSNGLKFDIREGTTDWNTVYACSVEDEYGLAKHLKPGKLVFDVGAHVGGLSVWALSLGCTVVAVEPLKENADTLITNLQLNRCFTKWDVVRAAIGTSHVGYGDVESGPHRYIANMDAPGQRVRQTTLTELVNGYGLPDILKLDCEGGEWDALDELVAEEIPLIVGEWHPRSVWGQHTVTQLIGGTHDVTFSGPVDGPGGFRAVRRG